MHHKAVARKALLNSAVKLTVIVREILFNARAQFAEVQGCIAGLEGIIGPADGLDALPECDLPVRQFKLEAEPLVTILRQNAHHVGPVADLPITPGEQSINEADQLPVDKGSQYSPAGLLRHQHDF